MREEKKQTENKNLTFESVVIFGARLAAGVGVSAVVKRVLNANMIPPTTVPGGIAVWMGTHVISNFVVGHVVTSYIDSLEKTFDEIDKLMEELDEAKNKEG